MVFALLCDGIPTRRSTSPTLMSWRRKLSSRNVSSTNEVSTVASWPPATKFDLARMQTTCHRQEIRSGANETKKTDKGRESASSIGPQFGGKGSRKTFRWECFPCTGAGPTQQPGRISKDCSPRESFRLPIAGRKPELCDSKVSEIQSTPG